ncbi:penicillin acylase family protein [Streptomyces sp. P9(2023)]|uniref:penicillin acylase family protein n=1 Tax=Streptomyces sp. P9(2023) TaxID=3064394 RepID=UPI0028F40BD4|nr:penicillin acylase family protein [Streptomyces sp. P9(2023)]MDT9691693.1 penicillin acylase family protein [Streptomyces sp. P9(2023)]
MEIGVGVGIEVYRDDWGIPHLRGADPDELAFAQGRVTAVDRGWQLEVERHRAQGTTAAFLGEGELGWDTFVRQARLADTARRCFDRLDARTARWVRAYVDGVNAGLPEGAARADQFARVGLAPGRWEPWTPLAVWLTTHILFAGFPAKLWREEVARRLGEEWTELFATDLPMTSGSNGWLVSGARTASGSAIIAGDPHRFIEAPGVYQQIRLACPEYDVLGLAVPGIPGLAHFGHTGGVAWAITNAMADYQDLYRERLRRTAEGGVEALGPDGWRAASVHREVVEVAGAASVEIEVIETERGPVIIGLEGAGGASPDAGGGVPGEVPGGAAAGDAAGAAPGEVPGGAAAGDAAGAVPDAGGGVPEAARGGSGAGASGAGFVDDAEGLGSWEAISLRYPPRVTGELGFGVLPELLAARTVADVDRAVDRWAEPVNVVHAADVDGGLLHRVAGYVPVRDHANSVRVVPAWEAAHAWQDGAAKPTPRAAVEGHAVMANARGLAAPLGIEFAPPHRAARIDALLAASTAWTPEAMTDVHTDTDNPSAARLLEAVRAAATDADLGAGTAPGAAPGAATDAQPSHEPGTGRPDGHRDAGPAPCENGEAQPSHESGAARPDPDPDAAPGGAAEAGPSREPGADGTGDTGLPALSPAALAVRARLLDWDRRMAADSVDAGLYAAVRGAVVRRVAGHPAFAALREPAAYPALFQPWLALGPRVAFALETLLVTGPVPAADIAAIVRASLEEVAAGDEPPAWGVTHRLAPWQALPDEDDDALWPGLAGDHDCVLSTSSVPGFTDRSARASAARYVWDLADRDRSLWVVPFGASGVAGDPHHRDQLPLWLRGGLAPVTTDWHHLTKEYPHDDRH